MDKGRAHSDSREIPVDGEGNSKEASVVLDGTYPLVGNGHGVRAIHSCNYVKHLVVNVRMLGSVHVVNQV